jgi:16S rRNA (guanine527-N7)-methyltransferase
VNSELQSSELEARQQRLNELISEAGLPSLNESESSQFSTYLELFLRWNERINLSAIRDAESILRRHFLESILCARALPPSISTLLDYGSGGGLPGIPIAILKPHIQTTLAESQNKKSAFLNEVVRTLNLKATVYSGRAEQLQARFDCVTLRAVDRMPEAVHTAAQLLNPRGSLVLMTTEADSADLRTAAGELFQWTTPHQLSGADQRILLIGQLSTL